MSLQLPSITIIQAREVADELVIACQALVPQLTSSNPPPTPEELGELVASDTSLLFLAREKQRQGNKIVGMATLVLYRVPTGKRAVIEDVVVDADSRGRGIGEALTRACLDHAKLAGCPQVMLTSNPGRQAANRLYRRMGFERRDTNVYRYNLSGK